MTLTRREKRKRGKGSDGQVLGERTELEKQIEDHKEFKLIQRKQSFVGGKFLFINKMGQSLTLKIR